MTGSRRILFCTLGFAPGPVGGAERQAQLQAAELIRRGHQVDVVCPGGDGVRSGRIGGVRVHRLPHFEWRPLWILSYLPVMFVWLVINVRAYDLVHVHLANLQADVAAVACRLARVPLYVKLAAGGPRGEIGRLRKVARLTHFTGIRSAARVQAISAEIEADVRSIGVPSARIVRIPNGIPPTTAGMPDPHERDRLRRSLGLPTTGALVLYAGRFARYKGLDVLLAVWRRVWPEGRVAGLILVGGAALDAPLTRPPSGPGVIVRPWSSDIVPYYRACDVFVLPSQAEGMSNSLLEAMSHGMAAVSTRVGAAPEMIEDGESGLLVGGETELEVALRKLVADPVRRAALGATAARRVRERFALSAVVDGIEAAYEEVLAGTQR